MRKDFVALILSNNRPDRVKTIQALRRSGYTGDIRIVVDDEDPQLEKYKEKFGDEVVVFSKKEAAEESDSVDNRPYGSSILYVRNASFSVAKKLGYKYFIQLDDDYIRFTYRFNEKLQYVTAQNMVRDLDRIFELLVDFFQKTGAVTVALTQGGDFIGGSVGTRAKSMQLLRKAMNSFICSVDKPFKFVGRINEDVNTYTVEGSRGLLFFSINQVSLDQTPSQSNPGGLTELYKDNGTYVKSFYSVIVQPSSVKISWMGNNVMRLHHAVAWRYTVPRIVREELRK